MPLTPEEICQRFDIETIKQALEILEKVGDINNKNQ
jgi:hypothetical protein